MSTGRVRYSPVLYAESLSNSDLTGLMHREVYKTHAHRTLSIGPTLVGQVPCQKTSQSSMLTPASTGHAHSRPPASGALCLLGLVSDSTPDAEARVRCLRTLRPVSEKHSHDFSKNSHWRNRKYTLNFLKSTESRLASSVGGREEPKPLSTLGTPPPLQMC